MRRLRRRVKMSKKASRINFRRTANRIKPKNIRKALHRGGNQL